jgi:hypothetical protein
VTDYDHLYKDEPWAKLAVKAGFRPGQTEASARHAFTYCATALEAAEAEIGRLRAALQRIADTWAECPDDMDEIEELASYASIARAALTTPPEDR